MFFQITANALVGKQTLYIKASDDKKGFAKQYSVLSIDLSSIHAAFDKKLRGERVSFLCEATFKVKSQKTANVEHDKYLGWIGDHGELIDAKYDKKETEQADLEYKNVNFNDVVLSPNGEVRNKLEEMFNEYRVKRASLSLKNISENATILNDVVNMKEKGLPSFLGDTTELLEALQAMRTLEKTLRKHGLNKTDILRSVNDKVENEAAKPTEK